MRGNGHLFGKVTGMPKIDGRLGPASLRTYKSKTCRECGGNFTPTAAGNLYCPDHAGKGRWERTNHEYHLENRRIYMQKWRHERDFADAEIYTKLVEIHGEQCSICGVFTESRKFLCVDHCHETGVIRGLLCEPCNIGLGWYRDDPDRLRAAAAYLEMTAG